ncbi:TetR/AcrR family transcriptional regulator [Glacieibacterium frigidum]|uniref:TetR/AcrR family transcriptional regulator n=1 Tax=Glacieibacterium frigidum TaxID=2593303 RepID=A0A552U9E5_9SPHN|nr:TetR/AcrR family transcriptional regulator [Glacieibacterium frigidum]TRW14847.1 TetR/AcrR family transcriptional regulator [Glacieibacterium frigidum]
MSEARGAPATGDDAKTPRTERGRRTLRAILDAAAQEFGEHGFHDAAIARITARAGVALGSFYTYFDSKEAVFTALVRDMSGQVRAHVGPHILDAPDRLTGERLGLQAFLEFVRTHQALYRILDEAEFVDAASWRAHYETTVQGYVASLTAAAARGEVRSDVGEVHAWAIVGMNVFLGLRYGVWATDTPAGEVAQIANDLLVRGLARRD